MDVQLETTISDRIEITSWQWIAVFRKTWKEDLNPIPHPSPSAER